MGSQRRVRRGPFLRSLEEDVQIRRVRPQREDGESEFIYPIGESVIKALIRPARTDADVANVVIQNVHYVCNLTPVRDAIQLNDQVVRYVGLPHEQVLTITFIDVSLGIQQLSLRDRKRVIE